MAVDPRAVIVDQVRNGVAVRMAVLFRLLAGEGPEPVADVVSDGADDRSVAADLSEQPVGAGDGGAT